VKKANACPRDVLSWSHFVISSAAERKAAGSARSTRNSTRSALSKKLTSKRTSSGPLALKAPGVNAIANNQVSFGGEPLPFYKRVFDPIDHAERKSDYVELDT
jgi:hypothetical protein